MARVTNTRARVREIARELHAEGVEPTPTRVRERLASGSASTIVDELRRWRQEELEAAAAPAVVPVAPPSPAPPAEVLERLSAQERQLESLANSITQLGEQLRLEREAHERQLELAYERFEAVQRTMMQGVAEARDQAAYWKAEAQRVRDESRVWLDTYKGALRQAQDQVAALQKQLHAREEPDDFSGAT